MMLTTNNQKATVDLQLVGRTVDELEICFGSVFVSFTV